MNYNPFSLEGKNILVTGASSGIGRATAIECSKLGATVIITARNAVRLKETYDNLEGSGHSMIEADLSEDSGLEKIVTSISEINGLVNVAGIVKTIPFQFIKKQDLEDIFAVNFIAPTLLAKSIVKSKKIKKGGSIVWVSSIDGPITAHGGNSIYAASKGAVSAMAKNMAVDLAPKNIRVNCVLPGMTETPLIYGDSFTEENFEKDKAQYPLKRYGDPKEIAWAIIYFLSSASSFTTGGNLIVDGGFTLL